jgi:hypothetical protein
MIQEGAKSGPGHKNHTYTTKGRQKIQTQHGFKTTTAYHRVLERAKAKIKRHLLIHYGVYNFNDLEFHPHQMDIETLPVSKVKVPKVIKKPIHRGIILKPRYQVTDPAGKVFMVGSLSAFCEEYKLNYPLIGAGLRGEKRYKNYGGYKIKKLKHTK